ncbi:MAG: PAAR domain-containing protein [Bacteroidota bacterium]
MKKQIALAAAAHICPAFDGSKAHVGGNATGNSSTVYVENRLVCRTGDELACQSSNKNKITGGSGSVFIEDQPVARIGDSTAHGGTIIAGGSITVHIS